MSQHNVNFAAQKTQESSTFNGQVSFTAEGELAGEAFFAPVSADLVDNLIGRYTLMRSTLTHISEVISEGGNAQAVAHFIRGNINGQRGYIMPVEKIFELQGAVASLNAEYWASALALTDVYEYMPNERRNEWNDQIREMKAPDFDEATVRATLSELLFSLQKFFSERVDGIFRSLSGEHVTNRPEGFGKRMIIARVFNEWNSLDHERSGYVDDLRKVIARFMGRSAESYRTTDKALNIARSRAGEWVTLDGGALRVKVFQKGTVHLEIHPQMAWRLNDILAFLHPLAIPAEHRRKPRKKAKEVELVSDLLPFSVLARLSDMETMKHQPYRYERWEALREPLTSNPYNRRFKSVYGEDPVALEGAELVLVSLGGVRMNVNARVWYEFDYDPTSAIEDIMLSGAVPDVKTHQFYPTREKLAAQLADDIAIREGEKCLEPSAGMGGLASVMPKERTTCVEISPLHCRVLEAKGYHAINADFLKWSEQTAERFDVVIMNPPFSEGRAEAHVKAAAELVKPGGRLGAILPCGSDRKELLPGWSCQWSAPHHGEFAGVRVAVVRLVAYRPE